MDQAQTKPLVIGIAGGTGSGKTTIAEAILAKFHINDFTLINQDFYYRDRSHLSKEDRENINYDHPDALETDLLIKDLKKLIAGQHISLPCYDFASHSRKPQGNPLAPARTIVVEGILVFVEKDLRELMDLKIFVDTEDDIRLLRRIKRDIVERGRNIESVLDQYVTTVKPMHKTFVEPTKQFADIIISGEDIFAAMDVIVSTMKSITGFSE